MRLSFIPDGRTAFNNNAVAICLFRSPVFSEEKHLKPLYNFIDAGGQEGYDLLVFHSEDITLNRSAPWLRTFVVNSKNTGFQRHLWRYLGGMLGYEWTWYRGSDATRIPDRELRLQRAAELFSLDIVSWTGEDETCTGRLCSNKETSLEIINFINTTSIVPDPEKWHCDEDILSAYMNLGTRKVLLAVDDSINNRP